MCQVRIGWYVFNGFNATVTLKGDFPKLEKIGPGAFHWASPGWYGGMGGVGHVVEFKQGLPQLISIGPYAFKDLPGTVALQGDFPLLERIDSDAFSGVGGAGSVVEFKQGLPQLKIISSFVFASFPGTIVLQGEYPKLEKIYAYAFSAAGRAGSVIELKQGLPLLGELMHATFQNFTGTASFQGGYPKLTSIAPGVFQFFNGTITFPGTYPVLQQCYRESTPQIEVCQKTSTTITTTTKTSTTTTTISTITNTTTTTTTITTTTANTTTTKATTNTTTTAKAAGTSEDDPGLSAGGVVGIVIAVVVLICVVFGLAMRERGKAKPGSFFQEPGAPDHRSSIQILNEEGHTTRYTSANGSIVDGKQHVGDVLGGAN